MSTSVQLEWFELDRKGARGACLGDWALQVLPPDPAAESESWRWRVLPIDAEGNTAAREGRSESRTGAKLDAEAALWALLATPARVVVEVENGRVNRIHADRPVSVVVVDTDRPSVGDWSSSVRDLGELLDQVRPIRSPNGVLEGRWPWILPPDEGDALPPWLGHAGVSDAGLGESNASERVAREAL